MKEHLMRERNRFSLVRFIREVFRAWKEQQDMYNYLRENQRYLDCDLLFPSKPLAKRYNVGGSSNARVWAVIEKYIESQKEKEQELALKKVGIYINNHGETVISQAFLNQMQEGKHPELAKALGIKP